MFIKKPDDTRDVYYQFDDGTEIQYDVYKQSTLATKFELIFDQVNIMIQKSSELKDIYEKFIREFHENRTINVAQKYLPTIFAIVDTLGEELGYHKYDYTPPTYKNDLKLHINENEYYLIMLASLRSKFICAQTTVMREENMNVVKYIYSEVMKEMYDSGTIFKIEKVVDSTVMFASSNGLDHKSQLWVVFSAGKGIDPQNIALRERNNVFYKGFPTIIPGRDPIKWIISIVRTSIKYLMKDKITQVNIAVNNPIETMDSSNNKLLQMFVYETVISNRQLFKLVGEMPFASTLMSEYVLPITQVISTPFVSLVFDMPNLNVTRLPNLVLLNLFTYKFMQNTEADWSLFNLLTCKATPKNFDLDDDNVSDTYYDFIRKSLTTAIKRQIRNLEFENHSTYTAKQLENVFKESIKQLFKYDYTDYQGKKFLPHPEDIVTEYITYIYNLSIGMYKKQIEEAKQYIMSEHVQTGESSDDNGEVSTCD